MLNRSIRMCWDVLVHTHSLWCILGNLIQLRIVCFMFVLSGFCFRLGGEGSANCSSRVRSTSWNHQTVAGRHHKHSCTSSSYTSATSSSNNVLAQYKKQSILFCCRLTTCAACKTLSRLKRHTTLSVTSTWKTCNCSSAAAGDLRVTNDNVTYKFSCS